MNDQDSNQIRHAKWLYFKFYGKREHMATHFDFLSYFKHRKLIISVNA